jgi:hypothetical protein
VAYSRTNIHHSGRGHKQADSAAIRDYSRPVVEFGGK